jgi:hypothetical protein
MNILLQIILPDSLNVKLKDVSDNFSDELAISLISTVATVVLSGIVARLTYQYAKAQMRKETFVLIERQKFNRYLESLEKCWQLLAYMTDVENEKSIFRFERDVATKADTWFGNKQNGLDFLKQLGDFFYGSGLGLYLPGIAKEKVFEFRSILMGFLIKTKKIPDSEVRIEKIEMINRTKALYDELKQVLKAEMDKVGEEHKKIVLKK